MKNERDTQKFYLLEALHKGCSNGDAFVMDDVLFSLCKEMNKSFLKKSNILFLRFTFELTELLPVLPFVVRFSDTLHPGSQ